MTYEVPAKNEDDYKVIGLSKKENKNYWMKDNEFSHIYNRIFQINLIIISILLNMPILFINIELNSFIYTAYILFFLIYNSFALYTLFHSILTLSFFYISMINFFILKYDYIKRKLLLIVRDKHRLDNRKLTKLIKSFNFVNFELLQIDEYFNSMVGINIVFYFFIAIVVTFSSFSVDIKLKFALISLITIGYILIVFIPFRLANNVSNQIDATNKLFQNISIYSKTSFMNKKRINYISFYTGKIGFTCFNVLRLNTNLGLSLSLQMINNIIMMIKVVKIGSTQF